MPDHDLFQLLTKASRFWLPSWLNQVATLIPSMCKADGCSIFLIPPDQGEHPLLHLAATTRGESQTHLFDRDYAYTVNKDFLRNAAAHFESTGNVTLDAGLTGWVAAFDRPLLLEDLHADRELAAKAEPDAEIPRPLWSDKNRGFLDQDKKIPRPFLCVPMHWGDRVIGAIRVATSRRNPQVFTERHQKTLQEVAGSLGSSLGGSGIMESRGLKHFFRIWAAEDADVLARRITKAVPDLFGVECCSFFLRDAVERFVLHNAKCADPDDVHFEGFRTLNRGNLYYKVTGPSKTSAAIRLQRPLVLVRGDTGWDVREGPRDLGDLKVEATGLYIRERPGITCEYPDDNTITIILVPVRDVMSIDLPAGVLRIVSTHVIEDHQAILTELLLFAEGLAGVIGKTWQEDLQRRARSELAIRLNRRGTDQDPSDEEAAQIERAAQIACKAVKADVATIFVLRGSELRTRAAYSVLSDRFEEFDIQDVVLHHQRFKEQAPTVSMSHGRTGWVARNGRVLNLKNLDDPAELKRAGVASPSGGHCELSDPGPFLAVPISTRPGASVQGVIRVLRQKNTAQGSFTLAHEEILTTCGQMLAAVLRWHAVVSFGTKSAPTMDVVTKWIEDLGGAALVLTDRAGSHPESLFQKYLDDADIAVTIATDDDGGRPSDYVQMETAAIRGHATLRARHVILRMEGVDFPAPEFLKGANFIEYARAPGGIHAAQREFATSVERMLRRHDA